MDQAEVGETEDLATLSKLDEQILLNELKARYFKDKIYTYVGDILVALNPFCDLGIYGKNESNMYKQTKRGMVPPHIFGVSDSTYQSMLGLRGAAPRNQCILISGESGAGKTESTKLIIKQLIELCKGNTQLEQQILQVNPLLEAFGNAQTLMNDNSSRFGKYIQLKFYKGHVMGAKISEYLLEKSRVIRQSNGEENFHIFYYLFAGLPQEQQERLQLKAASHYRYLCDGGSCLKNSSNKLKLHYEDLLNAMDMVGFSDEEQECMFIILAGILSLGNVTVEENEEGDALINQEDTNLAARLLGLDSDELHSVLSCSITVTKGDVIKRNYTKSHSQDCRDAVAKALYGRLFSWIVNKINTLLAPIDFVDQDKVQEIGILDIFGFEHFEKNSFEQACINLANEQLQFFFNRHVFMLEQEEYIKEGVDWNEIKFVDNQPLLDLFMARPIGLLALLDEESQFPKGTDQSFVDKLNIKLADNPHYKKSTRCNSGTFTIKHYAGQVTYNAERWLEKNRDTVPPGSMEMLQQSHNMLLSLIFKAKISRTGTLALQNRTSKSKRSRLSSAKKVANYARVAKARKLTVGHQFKNSLNVLMERMTMSQPVFVRCIKPNNRKQSKLFDDHYVNAQLLYTGMLETTKIRREGFAVRPGFQEFVDKYKILVRLPTMKPDADACKQILQKAGCRDWCVGKTKVFLKYWHLDKLADQMEDLGKRVIHMQRVVRGFIGRQKFKYMKHKAALEAEKIRILLEEIELKSQTTNESLQEVIKQDQGIPRDYFKKADGVYSSEFPQAETTQNGHSGPLGAEYMTLEENVNEELASTDDDDLNDDSDEDVLEDVFKPLKTTGAAKYGGEGTKGASVRWFKETQSRKLQKSTGNFEEWFHGIITRREAERLLQNKIIGCYLIRVSESRFGFSLSFRAEDRCRHYMIDQTSAGKYVILGEPKVHRSLGNMVEYLKRHKLSNWDGLFSEPCGQEEGQCDYADLIPDDIGVYDDPEQNDTLTNPSQRALHKRWDRLPPPLPTRRQPVTQGSSGYYSKAMAPGEVYQGLLEYQRQQISFNHDPGSKKKMSTARSKIQQKR